jgi:hypothetical protein
MMSTVPRGKFRNMLCFPQFLTRGDWLLALTHKLALHEMVLQMQVRGDRSGTTTNWKIKLAFKAAEVSYFNCQHWNQGQSRGVRR